MICPAMLPRYNYKICSLCVLRFMTVVPPEPHNKTGSWCRNHHQIGQGHSHAELFSIANLPFYPIVAILIWLQLVARTVCKFLLKTSVQKASSRHDVITSATYSVTVSANGH